MGMGEVAWLKKFIANAKNLFRYDACFENPNPPSAPLCQRGELSESPFKVPL
jgi:hypothetical protein